ncbi:N-acetyltransferase [Paenibacillus psychroresistens]|uniref:N-acetyltransferase n=1 Tax=Paenibacillus psychroresistens TaxID=1778678 RepID=A0A6B8RMG8_9BACL|nr:GNAT family N-acetyltransferase [Paenibacillus psychroresistens]QGQ96964.1 N-acetyltransferase [Paenibacillus psychroresistens]
MEDRIVTKRLHLRPFLLSDANAIYTLCNDIEVARTTLLIPHPYSTDAAEASILSNQAAFLNGTRYAFAIESLMDACLIGSISLIIDKQHKRAELSYWFGKAHWGQGYATEAASSIIHFGFENLQLHRIWAASMTKNINSIRVLLKMNMQYEGIFRQHILKWDDYEDVSFYGILKSEYKHTTTVDISKKLLS